MAKLNSKRFREVDKVAAFDEGGGRYLFALRSDGTILKRRTTEPADSSYHMWTKTQPDVNLRTVLTNNGFKIESSRADQRRERIVHEQKQAKDSDWTAIKPHECWACHVAFEEDDREFRLQTFRVQREDGTEATRKLIDEHFAIAHKSHGRSWV